MYMTKQNFNRAAVKALLPPEEDQWYLDMVQEGHDNTLAYLNTEKSIL